MPSVLAHAVVVVALLLGPAIAQAKALPFVGARQLAAWCEADGVEAQSLCGGYVLAVADVLAADLPLDGRRACLPVGARSGVLVDAVRRYLAANPKRGFERATVVAADALAQAYPCP
jgi:hypothetical protein